MKLNKLTKIEEIQGFLDGTQAIAFSVSETHQGRYNCISDLLKRMDYQHLKRQDKGVMLRFLMKVTGYSRQQITRLVQRYYASGKLVYTSVPAYGFKNQYTEADIARLVEIDKLHETPNGLRVKKLCERAYTRFDDQQYERLKDISVSHIYNLRQSKAYLRGRRHFEKTKSRKAGQIGQRKKPRPNGEPGYLRIDTVHQGDLDKVKGLYHINVIDEVTQFQVVATVERISEQYLIPVLRIMLDTFPFKIINFHSDNGSEFVNKTVAKLLDKLLIEFTKSRPRRSTDNALVEGKNAAVVRKVFGYNHIPQHFAEQVNDFNESILNRYINYHRPCLFPTIYVDKKGKQRKKYHYEDTDTPYEKFKSLPNAVQYLKEGVSFKMLDDFAGKMTDNQAAKLLQNERKKLFKTIHDDTQECA